MNKIICYIFIMAGGFIGCAFTVTPEEFKAAEAACIDHGGLSLYHNPADLSNKIVGKSECKDGLSITRHWLKKQ